MNDIEIIKNKVLELNQNITVHSINKNQIIFENRVRVNCFYCSKYNKQWTCPPNIPNIDYEKVISEYDNIIILGISYDVNNLNYADIRIKSTNEIHKTLLLLEKKLWDMGHPMAISFIGGSCKLCKNGCAEDKCRNSQSARIPIEATGINVIKTLKNIDIDVDFTNTSQISRYGMLLW